MEGRGPSIQRKRISGNQISKNGISGNWESKDLECQGVKDPKLTKSKIPNIS
jgi:hypothetical protein